MEFYQKINVDGMSEKTAIKAISNVLNAISREMYVGRVKHNKGNADKTDKVVAAQLGEMSEQSAEQFRKALQMFATTLPDEKAMEIATVYPMWEPDHNYAVGDIVSYGQNGVGDPQLYKIAQAHKSQADWSPDQNSALYVPIGLTEEGYPVWSQPSGAHDAYNSGDIVDYNGTLYKSLINGNTYIPGSDSRWWEVYDG